MLFFIFLMIVMLGVNLFLNLKLDFSLILFQNYLLLIELKSFFLLYLWIIMSLLSFIIVLFIMLKILFIFLFGMAF